MSWRRSRRFPWWSPWCVNRVQRSSSQHFLPRAIAPDEPYATFAGWNTDAPATDLVFSIASGFALLNTVLFASGLARIWYPCVFRPAAIGSDRYLLAQCYCASST